MTGTEIWLAIILAHVCGVFVGVALVVMFSVFLNARSASRKEEEEEREKTFEEAKAEFAALIDERLEQ